MTASPSLAQATRPVPWYIWLAVVAATSAMVGVHWDISWHRSIGRDSFLTPAHIAIYLCGVLAGISCGYLILSTTFGNVPLKQTSVNVWGLRGPLGAFIAAWGGFVMLISAPFDDWWHNAYGLDVKILSPPHMVLALGMVTVEIGALVLIAGRMNRAEGRARSVLTNLFLYIGAMVLVLKLVISMDYTFVAIQHSGVFYRVVSMVVPGALVALSRATGRKWAATTAGAIYSLVIIGFIWILPLFPATPKLGPVYYQVTHFVPPPFPVLIIIPAVVLDLLWARFRNWNSWLLSIVSGFVFVTILLAVQWPFADFLQSVYARNWIFGSSYFDYHTRPTSVLMRYAFLTFDKTSAQFFRELGMAVAFAIVTTRVGLACGGWLGRVRR
ncbi:MAG: hypothetical protein JWO80_4400 [Bryobacterales bacterium]|nr:hypothetical protein [Bryobacterales bacterium]